MIDKISDKIKAVWNSFNIIMKISVLMFVALIFVFTIAIFTSYYYAALLTFAMIHLPVLAILMEKGIIKVPKTWPALCVLAATLFLAILLAKLFTIGETKPTKTEYESNVISLEVSCEENWIFSTYDVKIKIDDVFEKILPHGESYKYTIPLEPGEYILTFYDTEDESLQTKRVLNVEENAEFYFHIKCTMYGVEIQSSSGNIFELTATPKLESEQETTVSPELNVTPKQEAASSPDIEPTPSIELGMFDYTTNGVDTYRDGSTGKYAYKKPGINYSLYYIIDFDEGYVYYFSDDSDTCDRLKIKSGTLKTRLEYTYDEGTETEFSETLYFKQANQPDCLIYCDGRGTEWVYYSTNLIEALEIRNTMKIYDH